jgi:hypothetical protein
MPEFQIRLEDANFTFSSKFDVPEPKSFELNCDQNLSRMFKSIAYRVPLLFLSTTPKVSTCQTDDSVTALIS